MYYGNERKTIGEVRSYVESRGDELLSKEYRNNKTSIEIKCGDRGHIFQRSLGSYRISGCTKCNKLKPIEEIREYIEGEGYTLLSNEYVNSKTVLWMRCPEGHEFPMRWNNFQCGQRCPERIKNKKKTLEEVREYIESEGYKLLSNEYVNSSTHLRLKCGRGHEFPMTWNDFQSGTRCPIDANEDRTGDKSYLWKGGVDKLNIPLYDTYAHQIDFCEEVRRDPDNEDWLQVRCTNCNEWFMPTLTATKNRVSATKNNGGLRFYCSDKCKHSCSIYGQKKFPKGQNPNEERPSQRE